MLKTRTILSFVLLFSVGMTWAQERVLFTVDGREKVTAEEFSAVFNKNRDIGEQIDPKTPEEYMQLYIDFKLKVMEAKDSAMDQRPTFVREFSGYRAQLAKPYLTDQVSEEVLIKEAFDRMQNDVKASHVMIFVEDFKNAEDTANAFAEISDIYDQVKNGTISFENAAKTSSDDTYSAKKNGSLGWFNVFDMVYEFESNVYNLDIGGISPVFKTQYGYHFARLDGKRPARGRVKVNHIMLLLPETANPTQSAEVERKINELYTKLNNGEATFAETVVQFSQDKTSKGNGGRLPEFGLNDMVDSFEDAAFSLNNPGDISKPVKTPYGWHIIELVEKIPLKSFEDMEGELRNRIKRDVRAELSQDRFIAKLASSYNWKVNDKNMDKLAKQLSKEDISGDWEPSEKLLSDNREVATYADSVVTVKKFVAYISKGRGSFNSTSNMRFILDMYLEMFMESELLAYEDSQLENKYPEFRMLVNEYRDGILLFDLTDKRIWSRSMNDSLGLYNYYEAHKEEYKWSIRHDYTLYDCSSKKIAKKVRKSVLKQTPDSTLMAKYNDDSSLNLQITRKTEENAPSSVTSVPKGEAGEIFESNGRFQFVMVHDVLPVDYKKLVEIKGLVAADYQKELEKEWVAALRKSYTVEVNEAVKAEVLKELAN